MAAVRRTLGLPHAGEMAGAIADTVADLDRALADTMNSGVAPGGPEANQLVNGTATCSLLRYSPTKQMQVCLGSWTAIRKTRTRSGG